MQLRLSENIKKHRNEMRLTQEGLAEAFGVTIGAVSKWENGNNVPDIMTLMELANFFNVSVDELLGYDMSSSIRFYFSDKKAYSFDSTGAGAVTGIESMFDDDNSVVTAKNYKHMKKVIDEWNRLKNLRD